jgi:shikimate 5-dehydrogenase
VYNPSDTRLLHEAAQAGTRAIGGLEMLIAQGAKQFEIWTGAEAPVEAMAAAVKKKLQ